MKPAPGEHRGGGDRVEALEQDGVGLVGLDQVALGDAVAGQVDGPGPEPVGAAEAQAGQAARRRLELGHQREVGGRLGVDGADVVAGVVDDGLPGALGRQAPAVPSEHRLVQVQVGVGLPGHRRARCALDEALVGLHRHRHRPAGTLDGVRALPRHQRVPLAGVVPDVGAVAAGDVLGEEVGRGVGGVVGLVGLGVVDVADKLAGAVVAGDDEAAGAKGRQGGGVLGHRPLGGAQVGGDATDVGGEVDRLEGRSVDIDLVDAEPLALVLQPQGPVGQVVLVVPRQGDEPGVPLLEIGPGPGRLLLGEAEVGRCRRDVHADAAVGAHPRRRLDQEVDRQPDGTEQPRVVTQRGAVAVEVDVRRLGRVGDRGRAQRIAGVGPVVEALGLDEGELLGLRRRQAAAVEEPPARGLPRLAREPGVDPLVELLGVEADQPQRPPEHRQSPLGGGREAGGGVGGDVEVEVQDVVGDVGGRVREHPTVR